MRDLVRVTRRFKIYLKIKISFLDIFSWSLVKPKFLTVFIKSFVRSEITTLQRENYRAILQFCTHFYLEPIPQHRWRDFWVPWSERQGSRYLLVPRSLTWHIRLLIRGPVRCKALVPSRAWYRSSEFGLKGGSSPQHDVAVLESKAFNHKKIFFCGCINVVNLCPEDRTLFRKSGGYSKV